jgi:hypothetical protein
LGAGGAATGVWAYVAPHHWLASGLALVLLVLPTLGGLVLECAVNTLKPAAD